MMRPGLEDMDERTDKMISINKVQLLGNLAREPEIKETANGKFARLVIATSRRYRDRETGEMKSAAQFHDVVVFNDRFLSVIENYCNKGTQVFVEGALESRSWTDSSNQKRYSTEVVLRAFGSEFQFGNRPSGQSGGQGDNATDRSAGSENSEDRASAGHDEPGQIGDHRSASGFDDFDDDDGSDLPF